MGDIWSIISSNYTTAGTANNYSKTPYVAVDPKVFQGTWTGTYPNKTKFSVTISNISGFRATAKYQSGSTVKNQSVLIKDNSFRVGDSKFTVTGTGVAQIKTAITDPVSGAISTETGSAKLD